MNWGGPEFVLAIIAIATFGGVAKYWIRATTGVSEHEPKRKRRQRAEEEAEVLRLRQENRSLTDRLETSEDRLAVLERIVTDRGYTLAHEIEALRDRALPLEDRSNA